MYFCFKANIANIANFGGGGKRVLSRVFALEARLGQTRLDEVRRGKAMLLAWLLARVGLARLG